MSGIRLLDAILEGKSSRKHYETRYCEASGCLHATREGKQYCTDHVDQHPYVQKLISAWDQKGEDDEKVEQKGSKAARLSMLSVQELISYLKIHGAKTVECIARELNLTTKVVENYAEMMRKKKIVSYDKTKRGSTILRLEEGKPKKQKPLPVVQLSIAEPQSSKEAS